MRLMNMKRFFLTKTIASVLMLFFLYGTSSAYVKDQKYLVPLDKEILLNWVNDNCHENHKDWDELISDGRIKCKPGPKPLSYKTLPFVKHYTSSNSGDINLGPLGWVLVLAAIFISLVLIVLSKNESSWVPKSFHKPIVSLLFCCLLAAGVDLYGNHIFYYLPYSIDNIFDAIEENDFESVRHFVEVKKVNPNDYKRTWKHFLPSKHRGREVKKQYINSLDIAAYRKHYEIARYLSEFTPEVNIAFSGPSTQLSSAAASGNYKLVTKVLNHKEGASRKEDIPDLTPLHYAVCAGNNDIVQLLLEETTRPDKEKKFRTPLDASIWCNNYEAMELLLNKIEKPHNNPIETAIAAGNIALYMRLRTQGFTTDRALEYAAKYQNYHMLEYLEDTHEFDNLTDKQIAEAISEVNRLKALRGAVFLYKLGFNINTNISDSDKSNLLIAAAKLQEIEVIKELLSTGFDKTLKDRFGYTALDYPISTKNDDLIGLLSF